MCCIHLIQNMSVARCVIMVCLSQVSEFLAPLWCVVDVVRTVVFNIGLKSAIMLEPKCMALHFSAFGAH
jgi:hypothetical protein